MVEKISVQIALEGGKEVEKQLADIGTTGNESFATIGEAGAKAADGIAKAGEASQTAADGIAKAGEASQTTGAGFDALIAATDKLTEATNKAVEAHSKLSLETVKTTIEIGKYTAEIALTGVEIVQAVRHHDTLIQSLIKLAGITNTTIKAVSLLTPELSLVGVTIGSTAAAIAAGAIGFEVLRKAAEAAAGPLAKLSQNLTTLSANTGETFDNLQRGKAAFEQLGISGENFAAIITKINEAMSSFDVGAKVNESFQKLLEAEKALLEEQLRLNSVAVIGMNEPIAIRQRLLEITKQLEVATSGQAKVEELAAAKAKTLANNLQDIIPLVQKIVDGQKGLTFDGLTTAATKIDAVTASMKQAGDSGKTAGQVLVSFIASADRLSAIQVGKQFGVSEEQIDRIRRLGGAISITDDIWKGLQSRGVLISPESAAALDKLQVSLDQATQAKARFNQAMATSVPATFAALVSSALEDLKTKLLNLVSTDIEALNRALLTLGTTSGLTNTISELEAVGRLLTSIGGQATAFSWGEIVATGGLASTRQELEAIGGVIVRVWESAKNFTWGSLWDSSGLANTRRELEAIGAAVDWLIDKFLKLIGVRAQAGGTPAPAPAPAAAGGGQFASGGLLGGRGSGTSDSNLAWVSRGEYIMPASAVRQPGVLAFLEALRRSGSIPGFAAGGSVPIAGIAFPGGAGDKTLLAIEQNTEVLTRLVQTVDGLVTKFDETFTKLDEKLDQKFDELGQKFDGLVTKFDEKFDGLVTKFDGKFDGLAQTVNGLAQTVNGLAQTVNGLARQVAALAQAVSQRSEKALGGLLGGRGSGTSDSNLAWVSRGEHIMPARAVAQPGVLAFLEALRRSGGNLRSVLDGMGRFALGGMVRGPMPAFANGGLAGGMSNVTIQFPGLPAIGGLRASSDVVDQLHKAAALAQVRSGGRKPSRYS